MPAKPRPPLTQERLRELLHYDPETGIFKWRMAKGFNPHAGRRAGCADDDGYIVIRVDLRTYKAHRLAFLYMAGRLPECHVDHRNGIRSDNRWANLREASPLENAQNRKKPSSNTSGWVGVAWHITKRRWVARISHKHIGYFDTAEQAGRAYLAAKAQRHAFQPTPREIHS